MYKTDNRRKKNRGRYTLLGIFLGVMLTAGGLYVYDNYKQQVIADINKAREIAVSSIPQNKEVQPIVKIDSPIIKPIIQISSDDLAKQIHALVNQQRENSGLQALSWDDRLAHVALAHSSDMMKNNYFDHNDLQGNDPTTRFSCYNPRENIAWTEDYPIEQVPQKIISDWISSSTHRDNILSSDSSEGIGVSISGSHIIVTDDFC